MGQQSSTNLHRPTAIGHGLAQLVVHGKVEVAEERLHVALEQPPVVRGFARTRGPSGSLAVKRYKLRVKAKA
jgi:hypothetical protein